MENVAAPGTKDPARLGTGRRGAPASEAERAGGCQLAPTEDVAARRIRRIAATHAACLAAAAAIDGRRKSYRIEPVPERVLYLLHNGMPYNSGGYAVRAHGLLRHCATAATTYGRFCARASRRIGFRRWRHRRPRP